MSQENNLWGNVIIPFVSTIVVIVLFWSFATFFNYLMPRPLASLDYLTSISAMIFCICCCVIAIIAYSKKGKRSRWDILFLTCGIIPITICYIGWGVEVSSIGSGAAKLFGVLSPHASAVMFNISTVTSVASILYFLLKQINAVAKRK